MDIREAAGEPLADEAAAEKTGLGCLSKVTFVGPEGQINPPEIVEAFEAALVREVTDRRGARE